MERRYLVALSLVLFLPMATVMGNEPQTGEKAKAADTEEFKGEITPELDRCSLDIEGRSFKPLSISSPNSAGHTVKDVRIRLDSATVRAFKADEPKPQWEATSNEGTQLEWLASDDKVIYLTGYREEKGSRGSRPETPLRVRRLEIVTGKWLDDLVLNEKPEPKENESINGVLSNGSRVVVLTVKVDEKWQLTSYQVSSFKAGETKPLWSNKFQSTGKSASSGGVLLLAARTPAMVQPDVQPLAWMGDDVVVCAGPVQDLLCLESGTGKQRWKVERVWEFERSFIGPSVWQHIFTRVSRDADAKKDQQSGRQNSIVGGPVVLQLPKNDPGNGDPRLFTTRDQRVFIAVAKGPMRWSEYVSDCVLYELNSDGEPLAMVNLPRMVRGGQYQIQKDGVVWACQGGAFVKVGTSRYRSAGREFGPGGPDLLCRLDWYRHLSSEKHEAWLTSDPAGEPLAFGKEYAFSVSSGGYIIKSDAGIYNFPLSIIDLRTGNERNLVLRVPYTGKIPEPKSNYSNTPTEKGIDRLKTRGPFVLAITGLQVDGNHLRVTLGMEKGARSLDFDIDKLQGQNQK